MARFNLSTSIKRLVSTSIKLLSKAFKPTAPARPSVAPNPPRPRPIPPQPVPQTDYQKQIEALIQQNEAQARKIAELEERQKELQQLLDNKPPKPEHVIPTDLKTEVESFTEDDLPYEIKDDTPEFGPDDLPYEIQDEEPTAFTYKDFGSNESLDVLIDFLKSDISGVATDSEFFNMDPTDQKFLLLDYVQFQHESNPALFYKGKKSLELENVPIWGAEFDRFVKNTIEFNDTTAGYSTPDVSGIDDLLSDYIEADY